MLALLGAGPAFGAETTAAPPALIEQIKHPVSWFEWGGDFRWRHEYMDNGITVNRDLPQNIQSYQRYRARIWGQASLRTNFLFKTRLAAEPPSPSGPPPVTAPRSGRGALGTLLAVLAVLASGITLALAVRHRLEAWRLDPKAGLADVPGATSTLLLALAAGAGGAIAVVLGAIGVVSAERRQQRPHALDRAAGSLGAIGCGLGAGAAMALWVLVAKIQEKQITTQKEMEPLAYVVLGAMLALLIVGLAWCFYRALKAVGRANQHTQLPEGSENG